MSSLTATTRIHTSKADGYLSQLCKHFGHKISVDQLDDTAVFHFTGGTVTAHSDGENLTFNVHANTSDRLQKIAQIIGSHLERFAFRENLTVTWPQVQSSTMGET